MQINKEKLKVIGGALIVLAAVAVMFNQVFNFAFGIVRMVSMILIALAIAWLITNAMVRLRGKKKETNTIDTRTPAQSQSPELAAKIPENSDNETV
jgi:predicted lipid-binding transport protein (Tim44 family)